MPAQQSTIETIFIEALAIDSPDERDAFLEEQCAGDVELRARVDALLRANNDAGSFLDGPPEDVLPTIAINSKDTVDETLGQVSLNFLTPCDDPTRLGRLGQYDVIEVLGRGGMGIVLRAHDTKLNRVVAIKVMAPELAANPMAVKRFLREAEAAAAVTHDHVVAIHAIEDEVSPPYIVMEFVDGLSLQEKVDRGGALELREILRIGVQTAAGLAAAHKQGLVHRDIKPGNILLENGVERVKITDFGLARAVDDVNITRTGMIAGTPQYMSPEQAEGKQIDHRSDLFALGSVLYAMCSGRPAFRADNPLAVMRRVCDDHPRAIQEINADVPDWLCAIVEKLLAKDSIARFQSAEEVCELLANWLAHVQQPALIPSPVDTGCQFVPRAAKKAALAQGPTARKGKAGSAGSLSLWRWPLIAVCSALFVAFIAFGAVIMIATDRGVLEVRSEVGDVQVSVTKKGKEVAVVDVATGSKMKWLASDDYEIKLVGNDNDIKLDKSGFQMSRLGRVIVTARWRDDDAGVIKRFAADEATITKDGVEAVDGGWKITAEKTRTVRLFETPLPELKPGPFFYHAKIKTENVKGRAYLEMWVRFPGQGEFFSKGFDKAVSGTNGWSEVQIPFQVRKDEKPDFVKLNVVVEGGGKVWVKDVSLRGRTAKAYLTNANDSEQNKAIQHLMETRRLPGPTTANSSVAWPTATRIVSGTQFGVAVWDAESGELVTELFDRLPADKRPEEDGRDIAPRDGCGLAVSADGKLAATGHAKGMVCIWDLAAQKQLHRIPAHWRTDQYAPSVHGLAFTPDGNHLVTAAVDGQIRTWNVASGAMVAEQKFGHRIRAMALHPDGKHVLAGSYLKNGKSRLALLNWKTGEVVHELDHHDTGYFALDISPDGRLAISGSNEQNPVRVWDLETGKQLHVLDGVTDTVGSIAFTPDGRYVIAGTNNRMLLAWDAAMGRRTSQRTYDSHATRYVAVSPDGRQMVTAGGSYWDYQKNRDVTDGDNDLRLWALKENSANAKQTNANTRRLKEIGSAFHNYLNSRVDGQESFPPAATTDIEGKPLLSWRVRLLPYLGERELYDRFHHDEPWDSPHNIELVDQMPSVYATSGADTAGKTSLMVFVGDDALFGGKRAAGRDRMLQPFPARTHRADAHQGHANGSDEAAHQDGNEGESGGEVDGEDHGEDDEPQLKPRRRGGPWAGEVTDGFANTILAIEAGADKAVPWTKPEDILFDPNNPIAALGKPGENGWLAVFGDGSVQNISADISPSTLQRLINPADGQAIDFPERVSSSTNAASDHDVRPDRIADEAEDARRRLETIEAWLIKRTEAGDVREVKIDSNGATFFFTRPVTEPDLTDDPVADPAMVRRFKVQISAAEERKREQMLETLEENNVPYSFTDE